VNGDEEVFPLLRVIGGMLVYVSLLQGGQRGVGVTSDRTEETRSPRLRVNSRPTGVTLATTQDFRQLIHVC